MKKEKLESMPFIGHLAELRRRLLWTLTGFLVLFGLFFYFSEAIFDFLTLPLLSAMSAQELETHRFIYTSLPEAFFTYVKLAFFGAAVVGLPFFLHQVWLFMAPGLYGAEKKEIKPFLIASPLLFYAGFSLAYFVLMPWAWKFFLSFEMPRTEYLPLMLEAKIEDYMDLVISLSLAFGLCFQLPIVLLLMAKADLIQAKTLRSKRRYAIILIFVLAAFLTPPDVLSQIALAVPLLVLYELTIYLMGRYERPQHEESADA